MKNKRESKLFNEKKISRGLNSCIRRCCAAVVAPPLSRRRHRATDVAPPNYPATAPPLHSRNAASVSSATIELFGPDITGKMQSSRFQNTFFKMTSYQGVNDNFDKFTYE